MSSASEAGTRPLLRSIEVIRVAARGGGLVTLLRDPEKVAVRNVEVPPPLDRALAFMDGRLDVGEIARRARVEARAVERLVTELEAAAMLVGPTEAARRKGLVAAFEASPVRPASFAGGAYHGDAAELSAFIDDTFSEAGARDLGGEVRALVAPHMDLWRASEGYARSYASLRRHLPSDLETIVVLGTCHAGMRSPFAFTRKSFETPFGLMATDTDVVDGVARRSRSNVLSDEYKHRGEHSIEFQVVFLQHVLAERAKEVRIVPILCGLGRAQATRTDPTRDAETAGVLGLLLEELAKRSVLVVAGADLAHVGPRFGDERALDERDKKALAARDGESVRRVMERDGAGFFDHVTEDLDARRVCGTGPLYTLIRSLEAVGETRSELLGYTQHVDPDEGSIVSHASLAFLRP